MSKLSVWFHKVADFLSGEVQNAGADQHATINDAADKLKGAAQAVESAIPVLAKIAVDGLLVKLGGGQYVPSFNEFADALIAELESRKTPATAPKAA